MSYLRVYVLCKNILESLSGLSQKSSCTLTRICTSSLFKWKEVILLLIIHQNSIRFLNKILDADKSSFPQGIDKLGIGGRLLKNHENKVVKR